MGLNPKRTPACPRWVNFNRTARGVWLLRLICLWGLGWLMMAYQMSWLGWTGTVICLVHLARAGPAAIPLVNAWITGVIGVAAYTYAQPVHVHWQHGYVWAASLLGLWSMALVTMVLLAQAPKQWRSRPAGSLLAGIYSLNVGLGAWGYWLRIVS